MNNFFEKLVYILGVNFSAYNVNLELDYLKKNLPSEFKNRNVTDLGCGDWKVSKKLISVLEPKSYLGIDKSESLVKTANKNGIESKIFDIENNYISWDFGILWWVVHHLENPIDVLKRLNKNFNNLIIRESVDDKRIFELGHKYNKKKLMEIIKKAEIKIIKIIEIKENKSLIIFI